MNKFAAEKPVLLFVITWFFVGMLFCDAANLDDLLPNAVVVHDDEDVAVAEQGVIPSDDLAQQTPIEHQAPVSPKGNATKQMPLPSAPVRTIIDQDSPSLAADGFTDIDKALPLFADHQNIPFPLSLTIDQLYIRIHSLLI